MVLIYYFRKHFDWSFAVDEIPIINNKLKNIVQVAEAVWNISGTPICLVSC